jgi:transcriptional regulator with XRE-family HTH domain
MTKEFSIGTMLRTARRRSDFSQRQLAAAAGVAASSLARIESDASADPRVSMVKRLFEPLSLRLAGLDVDTGRELVIPTSERWRDRAGRHYPPHLEPIPCVGRDDDFWWGWLQYSTWCEPPAPPYTYFVDRKQRDAVRQAMDPWRELLEDQPRSERSSE